MNGVAKKIGEKTQITEKFAKREINIETKSKYPEVIQIEFINDKCSLLDGINLNDDVEILFNIRGREWNERFFTRLEGYDCKVLEQFNAKNYATAEANKMFKKDIENEYEQDDDLPF